MQQSLVFAWKHGVRSLVQLVGLCLLIIQMLALPAYATSVWDIPEVTPTEPNWVVDQGDVLSRITESTLNTDLNKLAKQQGYEIRFVTIHRLDYGETVDSFATQLLEQWFPEAVDRGNKGVIVLDTVTNNTSLVVGEAIKSKVSDEVVQSIVKETIATPLRKSRYNQALQDADARLVAVLSGEPDPGPPKIQETINVEGTFADAEETEANRGNSTVWVIALLVAATVIPMATYYFYLFLQSQA
jgi:uncharacterized protein